MVEIREKMLDVLSKISRGSAFFLLILLGFAAILQIPSTQNFLADLLVTQESPVLHDILKKNFNHLSGMFSGVPGAENFLRDAKQWTSVEDQKIREFDNGFFLSLVASKGDVLHPFFGFFEEENGKIKRVLWSPHATGIVEKVQHTPNGKYTLVSFLNTSGFPWSAKDLWKNVLSDKKTILISDTPAGEMGTFLFPSSEKGFAIKNVTHGFLVRKQKK